MTKHDYEYIVLGLGGIGSGAAYWLARRAGQDVLGLEQFELGHVRGGSQDHSRIIRLAYHTPEYVELAKHAYQAWSLLEEDMGARLIVKTGGLDLAPRAGGEIDLNDYINSMSAAGVPLEVLDAAELMRRWPQFCLTDDIYGVYQADSGIAPAAQCNAAHQRMAREHGATLIDNVKIETIRPLNGEMEITAGGETYRCRKLILTAGAWTNQALAHLGQQLPLTVTQEQVTYFATPNLAAFTPDRFPIWIWNDNPCFYGFPVYGEAGVKVAQDAGGREVSAATRSFDPDPENFRRVEAFMQRILPTALGPVLYTKTCLYTLTPDRDFVIDTVPGHDNCSIAIGAGHGFKFASLIGRILSELALDGRTDKNISPYQIDRPILLEKNPPKSFLV